jgi:hypothetical protein
MEFTAGIAAAYINMVTNPERGLPGEKPHRTYLEITASKHPFFPGEFCALSKFEAFFKCKLRWYHGPLVLNFREGLFYYPILLK